MNENVIERLSCLWKKNGESFPERFVLCISDSTPDLLDRIWHANIGRIINYFHLLSTHKIWTDGCNYEGMGYVIFVPKNNNNEYRSCWASPPFTQKDVDELISNGPRISERLFEQKMKEAFS